jgi:hypothetical protein
MSRLSLLLLVAAPLLGCAARSSSQRTEDRPAGTSSSVPAEIEALTVPPLPDWVDKYADLRKGDVRFFNISRLMERFQLARHQAVELQNHYRDQLRATPSADPLAAFNTALERVRRGKYESGLEVDRLAKARFIVVFDLDETLYDQSYPAAVGASCHDLVIREGKPPSGRYVKLVPGWQQALERIHALGGAVVIFSANLDDTTLENLAGWKFGGVPLPEHPAIAGVLTNSHLVLQEKTEGVVPPRRGQPVIEPSKDLRILDETLRRVIIVDDNPTRLFQFRNSRIFKKFEADVACTTSDPQLRRAFEGAMPAVVRELEESVQYMNAHGIDFADAYLPYTSLGQVTLRFLIDSGLERAQALEYIRRNPSAVDPRY